MIYPGLRPERRTVLGMRKKIAAVLKQGMKAWRSRCWSSPFGLSGHCACFDRSQVPVAFTAGRCCWCKKVAEPVEPLMIPCSWCFVEAGKPCVDINLGSWVDGFHHDRVIMCKKVAP